MTWANVQTGDFNNHWLPDFIGRTDSDGEWWVALSTGGSFTNHRWGSWPATAAWAGVRVLAT